MIITSPVLEDGSPFPTLFWLTCPHLTEAVSGVESTGGVAAWYERMTRDKALAERMRAADREYRELRRAESDGGSDPCAAVGIAGQSDPLATKCLHAHVAAFLGGVDDPVGEAILAEVVRSCDGVRCAQAGTCRADGGERA